MWFYFSDEHRSHLTLKLQTQILIPILALVYDYTYELVSGGLTSIILQSGYQAVSMAQAEIPGTIGLP